MSSKQYLYGRLLLAAVAPSGDAYDTKGRHGLMEDVDGSSLPADSQRVGGHLALSLHSSEI